MVIFGSPGWGKTTFLRSLMLSLAARLSPAELQIYALDFAKGGLGVLKALPHLGAIIDSTEEQRVERLLRMLSNVLETRRNKIMQYGSLTAYNSENAHDPLAAMLIVVDNFGEFKENFEDKIPALISLVRDGRAFGIYFAITASQISDVPAKLYNLFTERMSLKLPDPQEYAGIVGRGAPNFNDVPGRGVVNINRAPLEFQCGIPMLQAADNSRDLGDQGELYEGIAIAMASAWSDALPAPVDILPELILLRDILPETPALENALTPIIGINDLDRKLTTIDLEKLGPHFVVMGPPLSGKTTAMRSWILSMAHCYAPTQLGMVLVDPTKKLFNYGGQSSLADLPHILQAVSETADVAELIERLKIEYQVEDLSALKKRADAHHFRSETDVQPAIVIVIDNFDEFSGIAGRYVGELGELARSYGSIGLHFVVAGSLSAMRTRDDLIKQLESPRYSLVLQDAEAVRNQGGKIPHALLKGEYPPGRGFVIKSSRVALTQLATPYNEQEEHVEEVLDAWVDTIHTEHPSLARWRYGGPLDALRNDKQERPGASQFGSSGNE